MLPAKLAPKTSFANPEHAWQSERLLMRDRVQERSSTRHQMHRTMFSNDAPLPPSSARVSLPTYYSLETKRKLSLNRGKAF
jgi:hypothetical protein